MAQAYEAGSPSGSDWACVGCKSRTGVAASSQRQLGGLALGCDLSLSSFSPLLVRE